MQSKVSIVVPCYNKVHWIAGMLESVLTQKWDSIELILVNDGSTDGTRKIISEFEPKFHERGYEIIIIDQENQGLAAAVRNGMLHMTGDYFCTIDCDDRLAQDYFIVLAGWLDENPEYDGVSCSFETEWDHAPEKCIPWRYSAESSNRLENYILFRMYLFCCVYLVRTRYIKKYKIVEKYHATPNNCQEPQLLIPYFAYDGNFKHIPKGLYLRNLDASDKSRSDTFDKTMKHITGYFELIILSINELDKPDIEKHRLSTLAELGRLKTCFNWTKRFSEAASIRRQWLNEYISILQLHFKVSINSADLNCILDNSGIFFSSVEKWLLNEQIVNMPEIPKGRIIGYGALGKNADKFLPVLKRTPYAPTVLWDGSAHNSSVYDGKKVYFPDFERLTKEDLLLVLPSSLEIQAEVKKKLMKAKSESICAFYDQIAEYFGRILLHPDTAQ